jgi:hypothetical protein
MIPDGVTLKISLSPRDHRYIKFLLPHQLRVWYNQVNEVLIMFDLHGHNSAHYKDIITDITLFIDTLSTQYPAIRLLFVDYSIQSRKAISDAYFGSKRVPLKTHRYGPYYAYFYGIYHAKYNYILNTDCDMFFGGNNPEWTKQAIQLMQTNEDVITCSPHPGPPRKDGKLKSQEGQIDNSALKKIFFKSISTRIFFIFKPSFIQKICPIPVKIAKWPLLCRAMLRGKPIYALPEDVMTDIMIEKTLKRVDFLGPEIGLWSLHPPYRNEQFFHDLPKLIYDIENNQIPDEQRGDYDINYSMINWDDARIQIKNASIKLRIRNFFKFGN